MDNKTVRAVRAVRATVELGAGIALEGYMLADGKFCYGLEYVSVLLGYSKNYFSRLTKNGKKKLQSLYSRGFTGYQRPLIVSRPTGGATYPETYSFDDFCIVIEYEAEVGHNPKAIALLTASFRELLRERSLIAFDLPKDSLEEKLDAFDNAIAQRLEWIIDNRQELDALWLPGDEDCYPTYKDWELIPEWMATHRRMK